MDGSDDFLSWSQLSPQSGQFELPKQNFAVSRGSLLKKSQGSGGKESEEPSHVTRKSTDVLPTVGRLPVTEEHWAALAVAYHHCCNLCEDPEVWIVPAKRRNLMKAIREYQDALMRCFHPPEFFEL